MSVKNVRVHKFSIDRTFCPGTGVFLSGALCQKASSYSPMLTPLHSVIKRKEYEEHEKYVPLLATMKIKRFTCNSVYPYCQ